MLKRYEMDYLVEAQSRCPYGRNAIVGDQRCINCIFHVMFDFKCISSTESVKKHMERLSLSY